jgi:cytochrome b6-f complex iron-sulfur subunit
MAGWIMAGVTIFGSLLGMGKLFRPRVLPEASKRFRVGKLEEFSPGTVKIIAEHNVRIHATLNGIAALSMVCTHLGCIIEETPEGLFSCPCHGSKFDEDGNVMAGPAPRPLVWLDVSQAADGSIVVDTAKEVPPGEMFTA